MYAGSISACTWYCNVCSTCPKLTLPWVLQEVLRRSETCAQAQACVASIYIDSGLFVRSTMIMGPEKMMLTLQCIQAEIAETFAKAGLHNDRLMESIVVKSAHTVDHVRPRELASFSFTADDAVCQPYHRRAQINLRVQQHFRSQVNMRRKGYSRLCTYCPICTCISGACAYCAAPATPAVPIVILIVTVNPYSICH